MQDLRQIASKKFHPESRYAHLPTALHCISCHCGVLSVRLIPRNWCASESTLPVSRAFFFAISLNNNYLQ